MGQFAGRQPDEAMIQQFKTRRFPEDGRAFARWIGNGMVIAGEFLLIGGPVLRLEFLETDQVRVIPFERLDIEGSPVGPHIGKILDVGGGDGVEVVE